MSLGDFMNDSCKAYRYCHSWSTDWLHNARVAVLYIYLDHFAN